MSWWLSEIDSSVSVAPEHADRAASMAVEWGVRLGLDHAEIASLRTGASLHDVGKERVPAFILHKQGPLTEAEWAVMRRHPQWGHDWAAAHGLDDTGALAVILHHHERWDGSGYPAGLSKGRIPLPARIFAVCDVFDALRSLRPYKSAWSLDHTLNHLEAHRGTQFDPDLVRLFLTMAPYEQVCPSAAEPRV